MAIPKLFRCNAGNFFYYRFFTLFFCSLSFASSIIYYPFSIFIMHGDDHNGFSYNVTGRHKNNLFEPKVYARRKIALLTISNCLMNDISYFLFSMRKIMHKYKSINNLCFACLYVETKKIWLNLQL